MPFLFFALMFQLHGDWMADIYRFSDYQLKRPKVDDLVSAENARFAKIKVRAFELMAEEPFSSARQIVGDKPALAIQ